MTNPTVTGDLELLGFSADWLQLKLDAPGSTVEKLEGAKKQIKDRFRKMSLIKHPDVGGNEKEFIEIREAFERLQQLRVQPKQAPVITVTMSNGGVIFNGSDTAAWQSIFQNCTWTVKGENE